MELITSMWYLKASSNLGPNISMSQWCIKLSLIEFTNFVVFQKITQKTLFVSQRTAEKRA